MTTVRRIAAAAAPLLLLLGGCATMFHGTKETLSFDANVPSVRLTVSGQYRGELPLAVELSKNFMDGPVVAKFEKPGFKTQQFQLRREFDNIAILDVSSPLTSGGIDALTGAFMKFDPTGYHVEMLEEGARADAPGFRRRAALVEFALVNFRAVQKDIARGGGERLAVLAALAARDGSSAAHAEEACLRDAPALLAAASAPLFLARLDAALGGRPAAE